MAPLGNGFRRTRNFPPLAARQRADDHVQIAVAQHFGWGIRFAMRGCFFYKTIDDFKAVFLVRLLPPFEAQLDPDLHVTSQEFDGMSELRLKIMRINVRAELNLFHAPAGGLVAFGRLGFLVEELAVINNAADRWGSGRGDFDEIELPVPRQFERGIEGHDSQLLLCIVDDTHLARADLPVSPVKRFVTLELSGWVHQFLERLAGSGEQLRDQRDAGFTLLLRRFSFHQDPCACSRAVVRRLRGAV